MRWFLQICIIYLVLYLDNQFKMLTYAISSSNLMLIADSIINLVIFILQYPDNQFKMLNYVILIHRQVWWLLQIVSIIS